MQGVSLRGLFSALCCRSRAITAPPTPVGSGTSRGHRVGCSADSAAFTNSNRLLQTIEPSLSVASPGARRLPCILQMPRER